MDPSQVRGDCLHPGRGRLSAPVDGRDGRNPDGRPRAVAAHIHFGSRRPLSDRRPALRRGRPALARVCAGHRMVHRLPVPGAQHSPPAPPLAKRPDDRRPEARAESLSTREGRTPCASASASTSPTGPGSRTRDWRPRRAALQIMPVRSSSALTPSCRPFSEPSARRTWAFPREAWPNLPGPST